MTNRSRVWLAVIYSLLAAAPQAARAQGSPYRSDDDVAAYADRQTQPDFYANLKFIALDDDRQDYLSFGGDLRERIEVSGNSLIGVNKPVNAYELHRLLAFADLHYETLQIFVQLGNATEAGRAPGPLPTDINRGDLAQGFVQDTMNTEAGRLSLRAGRFEMAYDDGALIGLRDGPNTRQVWDGFLATDVLTEGRLDAFFVRPVGVSQGYFDDQDVSGQSLWGAHLSVTPAAIAPLQITGFYYGSIMPKVLFYPRPGREETHTIGLRLLAKQDQLDGSIGGIGQIGSFASQDVVAFAAHADVGYTFDTAWQPRLGLRTDILSGGDTHSTVHTFNALYPNYAYSTEATIEAPANLIQPGMTLTAHPADAVTLTYTLEGLWRYSTHDAFYIAPTLPLVGPDGTDRSFSGMEQQVEASWTINQFIRVTGAYVHFEPSAYLTAATVHPQNFGMSEISFRF